jgi:hypothetical protein
MGIVSDFMFVVTYLYTYIYTELFLHRSRHPSFPSSPHIKLLAFELHSTSQNRLLPVLPGENLSCVSGMVVFTVFKHLRTRSEGGHYCRTNNLTEDHTLLSSFAPLVALCKLTQPRCFISLSLSYSFFSLWKVDACLVS